MLVVIVASSMPIEGRITIHCLREHVHTFISTNVTTKS